MGGGAWPFLVGGVICLLNCVNERDLSLLNRTMYLRIYLFLLRGTLCLSAHGSLSLKQVCNALRCSGLHARYTDELNKCATLPEKVGQSFENVS